MSDELDRARKLLAKAEATDSADEAAALTERAMELVAKYGIDKALLNVTADKKQTATSRIILILNPFPVGKRLLLTRIADAFNCQAIISVNGQNNNGITEMTVIGFPSDIDNADFLYTTLLLHCTNESEVQRMLGNTTRGFHTDLWKSYARRIGERLKEINTTVVAAYEASSPGTALVLSDRSVEVKRLTTKLFPDLRFSKIKLTSSEGYHAGREAANRANLGQTSRGSHNKSLTS